MRRIGGDNDRDNSETGASGGASALRPCAGRARRRVQHSGRRSEDRACMPIPRRPASAHRSDDTVHGRATQAPGRSDGGSGAHAHPRRHRFCRAARSIRRHRRRARRAQHAPAARVDVWPKLRRQAAAASVETVVVTSSKIKGDIQTVPIAITALSRNSLPRARSRAVRIL